VTLPEHRAGDADRDRVAAVLREAHAEGRLDADELAQRLDATYAARTFGELAVLTRDLPHPSSPPPPGLQPGVAPPAPRVTPSRPPPARRPQAAWAAWAVAVAVNMVVWVLVSVSAGEPVYFWPMWVAGPWGAVLAVTTVLRR
jgi:hypothetical protein